MRIRFSVHTMVDDAVPMIRRCIERIKLQWNAPGIDDVVFGPSRDDNREAGFDRRPNAIENHLTRPLLDAKELVELVDFRPDLFLGLSCHDDELAVLCRVKHLAKLAILDSETLDVLHKAFHNDSSFGAHPHAGAFDAIQPTQYVIPIETGAFNASLFARLVMLEESEKNDDRNRHA